ncbi:MAG: hypothetical protein QMD96_01885 [Anaerosomatales bacterium]|nr:hypothetical protein [Anaerosomatales bacterium]
MNRAERRRARRESGESTRGEVRIPLLHEHPGEWERNNALFVNRLMRRGVALGKTFGWLLLMAVALGFIQLPAMGIRSLLAR